MSASPAAEVLTAFVVEFVARTRVLPFLHQATGIPLDVVLAGPGLEKLFLDLGQIRETLDLLDQALGRSDLSKALEAELQILR